MNYRFSGLISVSSLESTPSRSLMSTGCDYEKHKSIIYTMATCHSLRVVDGELLGDPLDVKMFQFTGWSYEEGESHPSEQSNVRYDTIVPSVAKPPASTAHISSYEQGNPDVSTPFPFRPYLLILN